MSSREAILSWLRGMRGDDRSVDLDTNRDGDRLTLADLQLNERGRVVALTCGPLATNRLASLGFTPGVEVDMTQNYGRGPIIVGVRGGRVALGRGEARTIFVVRV